jgi:hypothetical protein
VGYRWFDALLLRLKIQSFGMKEEVYKLEYAGIVWHGYYKTDSMSG